MLSDLRLAIRALSKAPAFTLVAVLTLALGIGANSAVFSIVDAVLLRPLVYRDDAQLLSLYEGEPNSGPGSLSYPDFRDWRAQNRSFEDLGFARAETFLLRRSEGAEKITGAFVTHGYFKLVGGQPLVGRTFAPEEERAGGPRVVVLPYRSWMRLFGGDRSVVGRTVTFNEGSYTVVGVMPPGYEYPGKWADFWSPIAPMLASNAALQARDFRVDTRVIGRMRVGVTSAAALADLKAISARLAQAYPKDNARVTATAIPLRQDVIGNTKPALLVLLGAVALVLLVACADVANLSLVRASGRQRELAVRAAMGAARWQIARQLLAESIVLALLGGLAGVLLASFGVSAFKLLAAGSLPRIEEIGVNARLLAFTTSVSLLTAVMFGVVPALQATSPELTSALREGGRGSGFSRRGRFVRDGLVVTQVALALVLLVGSALLVRSFASLRTVNPGFEPEHLVTLNIEPLETRYDSPEKLRALYDRVRDEVARVPGVQHAGYINHLPLTGTGVITSLSVPGRTLDSIPTPLFRLADAEYFGAMGQRVVRGRGFMAADMTPASTAVVVNETLAKRIWKGADPVGQTLVVQKQAVGRPDFHQSVTATVVGVVHDVKFQSLDTDPYPEVYLPFPVNPWRRAFLAVRTQGDPQALLGTVRRAVARVDADIPVAKATTLDAMIATSMADRRFNTSLVAVFAATALLLAVVGMYGVISYTVTQRTQEIGIRSALGARPRDVVALFVGQGARLTFLGLAAGTLLALASTRVLTSLLFGVGATDIPTFSGAALGLAVVAILATLAPAWRASAVDPVEALRYE